MNDKYKNNNIKDFYSGTSFPWVSLGIIGFEHYTENLMLKLLTWDH
jgi:hypothetical protein